MMPELLSRNRPLLPLTIFWVPILQFNILGPGWNYLKSVRYSTSTSTFVRLLFTKSTDLEIYIPLQTSRLKMHFRILLALFAFTSLSIAEGSRDDNDLDKRLFSPPGCFCCTGYVVTNIAGTRCGHGEQDNRWTQSAGSQALDDSHCDSRDRLCCNKGAIVWPKIVSLLFPLACLLYLEANEPKF